MSASTSTVLTATAISFGNEWLSAGDVNFRIPIAGIGVALMLDGLDKISAPAANGLATIIFITVMFTPFKGNSPAGTVAKLFPAPVKAKATPTGTILV
jgi:hypothetical protein